MLRPLLIVAVIVSGVPALAAAVPAPVQEQASPPTGMLATLMCQRGDLAFDDPMSEASLASDWGGFAPGRWVFEPQAVRVSSQPGEHGPYRLRKLDLTDLVIQLDFRMDGPTTMGFGMDDDRGRHLLACRLSPSAVSLQRRESVENDRQDHQVDRATVKLAAKTWHTLVWEIHGTEMLASIDQQTVLYGDAEGIAIPKAKLTIFTTAAQDNWAWIAHVQAWQATLSPDWEAKKSQVVAYKKKRK